eukprot:1770387-Rhodomonas_salina.1
MPGTDIAYAAMRCPVLTSRMLLRCSATQPPRMFMLPGRPATRLRACYAMTGTDLAYGAIFATSVLCDP